MVTRLLLLAGLLLGLMTPPSAAGMEQHCRDHGAEMTAADHSGEAPAPHHLPSGPATDHCPPVQCAVETHCATAALGLITGSVTLPLPLAVAGLADRASLLPTGRTLQPPTPPPDSHV
jgi:hypothetical protein